MLGQNNKCVVAMIQQKGIMGRPDFWYRKFKMCQKIFGWLILQFILGFGTIYDRINNCYFMINKILPSSRVVVFVLSLYVISTVSSLRQGLVSTFILIPSGEMGGPFAILLYGHEKWKSRCSMLSSVFAFQLHYIHTEIGEANISLRVTFFGLSWC